ncbi:MULTISPECIES: glycosyltransferase family 2 protein [unclassified Priestia]|uniref:glycosyltransferase family 2 protein n=1 Tax=unclassified Priestia TaxID=2800374 RepID=UPI00366AD0B8
MKDIHVLLLDYSSSGSLKQALTSLKFIRDRIRDVAVLRESNLSLQLSFSTITQEIKYIKLISEDLGASLNEYIETLTFEYVLFLSDQDYFNSNIKEMKLELYEDQYVMTYPYILKGKVIQKPLLVKTSFLKQAKFFSKYQVPFKEAVFPSWLSRINKSSIITVRGDSISQTNKSKTRHMMQKFNFIEKYQYELEPNTNSPSISVILSNYNMADYVEIAINSCLLQSNLPEKILIIDDGSTDNSYEKLEKWKESPLIKLFKQNNRGKARALNNLIPYIETEFVVELDADDWFDPDAFSIIKKNLGTLPDEVGVLYGNIRNWLQLNPHDLKCKGIKKGKPIRNKNELLSYLLPVGPRIYRTSSLKRNNGFPIIKFEDGRMYEDVSVLNDLLKKNRLLYRDFTVYNVRVHDLSITKKNHSNWSDFIKYLD